MNKTLNKKKKFLIEKYYLYIVTVAMIIFCSVFNKNFLSINNMINILTQMSFTTIAAFSMTLLLITGVMDLALGSTMALAGIASVVVYVETNSFFASIAVAIIFGVICNAVTGSLINKLHLHPFIVGLGTQQIYRGIVLLYTGGAVISQVGDFKKFGQGRLFGVIPYPILMMFVIMLVLWVILEHTTTQPQLSKKISSLENRIGARLFDRSKRQVKLTAAGEQLYSELEPQVKKIEESFERIRRVYKGHSSALRICCDERLQMVEDLLFPTIIRFQDKNSNVMIELESFDLPILKNKLIQRETDILLSVFPDEPAGSKGIIWLELKAVQMCIAVRADHPFANRRLVTWAELKNEVILTKSPTTSYEYYDFLLEESKDNGFSPNIRTYLNEQSVILNLGLGSGICVGIEYEFSKDNKNIMTVPLTNYYGHIYAGVREESSQPERLFAEYLLESFKNENIKITPK